MASPGRSNRHPEVAQRLVEAHLSIGARRALADDERAGYAVLARGDLAREGGVLHRVVLGPHREVIQRRVAWDALGQRPRDKNAVSFQAARRAGQIQPIQFSVDLKQKVFYRGEHVTGKFVLKYYYGTPLAGRTIQYKLGDDRLYTAETDASGATPTVRSSISPPPGTSSRK